MSGAGVGNLCFLKVTAAVYHKVLEYAMIPSADPLS